MPMIVYWPGVTKPGGVSDAAAITMDVHATLLEMCNLPKAPQNDGVSLSPLLRQTGDLEARSNFLALPAPPVVSAGGTAPYGAVRAGDFKLIEFFNDMHVELYNIREDVGEQHELAAAMPEKVEELRARLHAWRKSGRPDADAEPQIRPFQARGPTAETAQASCGARTVLAGLGLA